MFAWIIYFTLKVLLLHEMGILIIMIIIVTFQTNLFFYF